MQSGPLFSQAAGDAVTAADPLMVPENPLKMLVPEKETFFQANIFQSMKISTNFQVQ